MAAEMVATAEAHQQPLSCRCGRQTVLRVWLVHVAVCSLGANKPRDVYNIVDELTCNTFFSGMTNHSVGASKVYYSHVIGDVAPGLLAAVAPLDGISNSEPPVRAWLASRVLVQGVCTLVRERKTPLLPS